MWKDTRDNSVHLNKTGMNINYNKEVLTKGTNTRSVRISLDRGFYPISHLVADAENDEAVSEQPRSTWGTGQYP